ncbi:MAG: DUF1292 domain-containing protein [Clostridia bacterium]|nr:DUF1292 domain-containing protein [Clostridia bacterium]
MADKLENYDGEIEDLDSLVTLTDEDGKETEFEFLDLIEYRDRQFVVLLPTDETGDSGEVVILEVKDYGSKNESYYGVDDENTLMSVFRIFRERFKEILGSLDGVD